MEIMNFFKFSFWCSRFCYFVLLKIMVLDKVLIYVNIKCFYWYIIIIILGVIYKKILKLNLEVVIVLFMKIFFLNILILIRYVF